MGLRAWMDWGGRQILKEVVQEARCPGLLQIRTHVLLT